MTAAAARAAPPPPRLRSCRPLLVGCGLLLLVGCGGLFHSNTKPEQIYYLRAPGATAGGGVSGGDPTGGGSADASHTGSTVGGDAASARAASVRVGRPLASPGLDTAHIMLVQADRRMNFYTGSRWPAPAPEVIEALVVETLRGSGAWSSVEDSASPFPSEYLLQIRVRRFEADYGAAGAPPVVQVRFDCIIGRREGREVLATFNALGSAPAAANRLTEVVAAFEQATGSALESLAQQSLRAVRTDAQRAAQNGAKPLPSSMR